MRHEQTERCRRVVSCQTIHADRQVTWQGFRCDLLDCVLSVDRVAVSATYLACRYGRHVQGYVAATMVGCTDPCELIFSYLPRSKTVYLVSRQGIKKFRCIRRNSNGTQELPKLLIRKEIMRQ